VLGSVTILVNSTTPVTAEKAKEALANLMGINPAQIEELNASTVQTASGATTFAVDYVIKVWSLEEAQQADPTATEAQSTGTILGFSFALRAEVRGSGAKGAGMNRCVLALVICWVHPATLWKSI
jgi:hypothetical protein